MFQLSTRFKISIKIVSGQVPFDENPFSSVFDPKENETKGGIRLTQYLTYNCIDDPEDLIRLESVCEFCGREMYKSALERVSHFAGCFEEKDGKDAEESKSKAEPKLNPLAKKFNCDSCKKTLYLTTTEMLKHRKSCLRSDS